MRRGHIPSFPVTSTWIRCTPRIPNLESSAGQALRADRVNRAWRELSPKCQQALLLRWRDGLRVKEICAEMGLSQGMVKKYLAQGLAHFRKRLSRFVDSGA